MKYLFVFLFFLAAAACGYAVHLVSTDAIDTPHTQPGFVYLSNPCFCVLSEMGYDCSPDVVSGKYDAGSQCNAWLVGMIGPSIDGGSIMAVADAGQDAGRPDGGHGCFTSPSNPHWIDGGCS